MILNKALVKSPQPPRWAQSLTRQATVPVFPRLPSRARPYLLAVTLFAVASALMYVGDAALLRFGLPWSLVSLLVVVAAANLWGVRPAFLLLALCVVQGIVLVPHVGPAPLSPHPLFWQTVLVRTFLFIVCGTITIWLTYRARLMRQQAESKREVVTVLRSMMLPDALTDVPGYDLCSIYRPAQQDEEVGGDFYDFYPLGEGRYGLFIGDVMGHGKEAAASTALLRYSVRAFTSNESSPARVLAQLNRLIDTQEPQFQTASFFLGVLDTRSGSLCYANAGHEPPMLKRADGDEAVLSATGPILGTGLSIPYKEHTIALAPNDALFLMTDGVTEARNAQGRFLDKEGTWQLLRSALAAPSARDCLQSLDTALTTYYGTSRCDDIAMLLLRATPRPDTSPRSLPIAARAAR